VQGARIRDEWIASAATVKASRAREQSELKALIEKLKGDLSILSVQKEAAEAAEQVERDRLSAEKKAAAEAALAASQQAEEQALQKAIDEANAAAAAAAAGGAVDSGAAAVASTGAVNGEAARALEDAQDASKANAFPYPAEYAAPPADGGAAAKEAERFPYPAEYAAPPAAGGAAADEFSDAADDDDSGDASVDGDGAIDEEGDDGLGIDDGLDVPRSTPLPADPVHGTAKAALDDDEPGDTAAARAAAKVGDTDKPFVSDGTDCAELRLCTALCTTQRAVQRIMQTNETDRLRCPHPHAPCPMPHAMCALQTPSTQRARARHRIRRTKSSGAAGYWIGRPIC
jgi:hypothetical protein